MTVFKSAASFWPSGDNFFDGELSGLEASAEFRATSICLLDGTLPFANAKGLISGCGHKRTCTWRMVAASAVVRTLVDSIELEFVVDVLLFLLHVHRNINSLRG